jgi:hypothetical protein
MDIICRVQSFTSLFPLRVDDLEAAALTDSFTPPSPAILYLYLFANKTLGSRMDSQGEPRVSNREDERSLLQIATITNLKRLTKICTGYILWSIRSILTCCNFCMSNAHSYDPYSRYQVSGVLLSPVTDLLKRTGDLSCVDAKIKAPYFNDGKSRLEEYSMTLCMKTVRCCCMVLQVRFLEDPHVREIILVILQVGSTAIH